MQGDIGMFQKSLYTLYDWKDGRMEDWKSSLPSFHSSIRAGFLLSKCQVIFQGI